MLNKILIQVIILNISVCNTTLDWASYILEMTGSNPRTKGYTNCSWISGYKQGNKAKLHHSIVPNYVSCT